MLEDLGIDDRGAVQEELALLERARAGELKEGPDDAELGPWIRGELARIDAWPRDGWIP